MASSTSKIAASQSSDPEKLNVQAGIDSSRDGLPTGMFMVSVNNKSFLVTAVQLAALDDVVCDFFAVEQSYIDGAYRPSKVIGRGFRLTTQTILSWSRDGKSED